MDDISHEILSNTTNQCTIQVSIDRGREQAFNYHKPFDLLFTYHILFLNQRIQDGQASYVACHNESYVEANKFDVIRFIKKGGSFFLNTRIASLDPDKRIKALEDKLSPKILRTM